MSLIDTISVLYAGRSVDGVRRPDHHNRTGPEPDPTGTGTGPGTGTGTGTTHPAPWTKMLETFFPTPVLRCETTQLGKPNGLTARDGARTRLPVETQQRA